jgi:hypothetical protein
MHASLEQPDFLEKGESAGLALALRAALNEPGHHHVLYRIELGQQVMKLKHETDGSISKVGEPASRHGRDFIGPDINRATRRYVESADAVK